MSEKPTRNRAEWFSLGISLTLLSAVVATVASLWLKPSLKPAEFTVEPGEVRPAQDHYYLPITITNEGDATAAEVTVEGTLETTDPEEVAATTFDFIPARSQAEGFLIFTAEPSTASVRVISYQKP
ncbi:hypothetical protein [Phormidium tenue]|uniref:TIGR02588 family protein n=1 Tax=Phormidium tenue NIES-30 TaxID=549789 RepID=A0A1U7J4T0_9CYAN|nr:hypothetical protein [Phormidium tenue]MBD2232830.1 hypothetical protein [Phormidium tenue FACHB-1052]OKH47479.1 hypothetical protein NIES30_13545 [Phormidium tenue NIES-30]